jgi:TM2 domain-containing membrane protein YozV
MSDTVQAAGLAATAPKYCSGCGLLIHKEAPACPKCGAPQAGMRDRKSRGVAIVLALFLGGFGGHKFYLGRPGWGVVYLLFFWTFIPGIVAFIELIIYACMSDAAFHEKYG